MLQAVSIVGLDAHRRMQVEASPTRAQMAWGQGANGMRAGTTADSWQGLSGPAAEGQPALNCRSVTGSHHWLLGCQLVGIGPALIGCADQTSAQQRPDDPGHPLG